MNNLQLALDRGDGDLEVKLVVSDDAANALTRDIHYTATRSWSQDDQILASDFMINGIP